jgi:periplasmic nitrate reductase NapD
MTAELHIASMVVHCVPSRLAAVAELMSALPGAVVHAMSPEGKAVVTLEASSSDDITANVARIQHLQGVLSAALVYQCADDLAAMNEEMPEC